ncbi:hypothetical protein BBP40_000924 [Aspergillus hancockii]|nr:hypothetical protein BBP40_000924 [Aspergillus hancockii]
MDQGIPHNYNLTSKDLEPHYSFRDTVSVAIRQIAETNPLSRLHLIGFWAISPALFTGTGPFPSLKDLKIKATMTAYDGRWYYTGGPETVEAYYEHTTPTAAQTPFKSKDLNHVKRAQRGAFDGAMSRTICGGRSRDQRRLIRCW